MEHADQHELPALEDGCHFPSTANTQTLSKLERNATSLVQAMTCGLATVATVQEASGARVGVHCSCASASIMAMPFGRHGM